MKKCNNNITKTILIPGNHDFLVNNIDRLDALSPIIDSLNNNNIVYYKDRGVYEDDIVSWCVYSQYQGNIGIQGLDGFFAAQGVQGPLGPQGVQGTQGACCS